MILYIIRFCLCTFAFFLFYKAFLEQEKAYVFNRFFLLSGIIISLITPIVTFNTVTEINEVIISSQPYIPLGYYNNEINYILLIHFIITSILLMRFIMQLVSFSLKIRKNELIEYHGAKIVLTNELNPPYTFLNYIFINRNKYNNMPNELMLHELTHVKQKHTLDIIFLELIKTIFWFNPVLIVYKKAIQLNHEFLADQGALNIQSDLQSYQTLLLSYIGNNQSMNIASNLNFSLTKKRFIMMSKTKTKIEFLKKLLVVPVIIMVFIACSAKGGATGKEMLEYWRSTANIEEILRTGTMNDEDLKDGIIVPIETKDQYERLLSIYKKMNGSQKKSVYELPPYLEPIK